MTPRLSLVAALLACLLLHDAVSLSLPSLFGSRVTKEDSKKETAKDDVSLEDQDHSQSETDKEEAPAPEKEPHKPPKPTRPPLLLGIPHPADHPLHPHNRPDHPLHPDNLPHLPSLPSLPTLELPHLPALPPLPPLPSLPHFTRETIHATKTVFVEVTDKVTVHPVCMTVYKVTPPCLPYNPHQGWKEGEVPEGVQNREGEQGSAIQPTAAPQLISPTATAAAGDYIDLEPTRILGGEYMNDASPAPSEPADPVSLEAEDPAEARDFPEEGEREGRWVRLTPPIKVEDAVKVKDDQPRDDEQSSPAENSGLSPLNMVQQLIQRSPVTHYKTKTLWVTKVEKVLDTRVTATLIAKNCIPTNSHIPYCAPHGGLLGPGYHHSHHGAFLEALGGVFVSGGFTDKVDGDRPESGSAVQEQQVGQNLVIEAPEVEAAESVKQQSVVNVEDQKVEEEKVEEEETTEKEGEEEEQLQTNTDNDQVT